jgi:uncharacterized protein (TIGR02217 family)
MPPAFHDVRFPLEISLRSSGGPQRRTDVVTLASGHEERNSRWAHARRSFDAGMGVRSLNDLSAVIAFFEERRGRLYGFRFRDRLDCRSGAPGSSPQPGDQVIGTGTGTRATFQLTKTYGAAFAPYARPITKPVSGSVVVAVNGVAKGPGTHVVNAVTGVVQFQPGHIPAAGEVVTAGYLFDVPVRFDADEIIVDLAAFEAGEIPRIPLIEIIA